MDIKPQNDLKQMVADSAEVLDVQRQIEKSQQDINQSLKEMIGFSTTLRGLVIDRFKRERELAKDVKNIEQQLQNQRKITAATTDEATRTESKLVEEGMAQRLTAYTKELDMLKKVNSAAIGPFIYFFTKSFELFKSMDKAAAEFRKTMGLTRDTSKDIRNLAQDTAIEFMHIGVTIEGAYAAVSALGEKMGGVHSVSQDLVKTTAILKAQLGVAEESTAGFLRNMAAISGTSMDAQKSMAFFAGSLSEAAGVPLNAVMKDIASRSSTTLTMISRIPSQVIKSAVELRRMGTDLDSAAKSSRDILNFTDNINAEMEASVLLGKSINLQRARELAYHRDIIGSTKEILRISKSIDFASLDVFQQEAFAKATGKSVDELLAMVQAERQLDQARKDPKLAGRVAEYEALRASNERNAKASGKNLEYQLMIQSNQERLVAITQKWNQILAEAGQLFLPIIDVALAAVIPILDIAKGIAGWSVALKTAAKLFEPVSTVLSKIGSAAAEIWEFLKGFRVIGSIVEKLGGIGSKIGAIVDIGAIFGETFGKAIPILGEVIMAVQFIYSLGKRLIAVWSDPNMNLGQKLLHSLYAVGGALYDTLIKPFVQAWNWIKSIFVGHSPSVLGLGIVNGIKSITGMLFDVLTAPWRNFLAWAMEKIPFLSKFAHTVRGGATGLMHTSVQAQTTTNGFADNAIVASPAAFPGTEAAPAAQKPQAMKQAVQDNSDKLLTDIFNAIKQLNSNLEAGKIGIYIDGQLMSATLARQTEFKGGYGTNNV